MTVGVMEDYKLDCVAYKFAYKFASTASEDTVPKTCDGWDKTWGEGTEGLEIKQKRNHASPTFLAEIVQDIKVREEEEVQTIRRRRVHANLPLPESHTFTSKLMLSPLTFFVDTGWLWSTTGVTFIHLA
jgi:hypothetical protein